MAVEMLPQRDVLVVPSFGPICRGDVAVTAADNTWPVVLLGLVVVIMFILARRGARAFSFALSFNNLWSFLGVRGWFRVTIRSYKSSAGSSSCFVTTSSKFSPELTEEEDSIDVLRPDQFCISKDRRNTCRNRRNVGGSPGSSGFHTEMVFMYDSSGSSGAASASSLFTSAGAVISTANFTRATFPGNAEIVAGGPLFRQTIVLEEDDKEIRDLTYPMSTYEDFSLERALSPIHGCVECQGGRRDAIVSQTRKDRCAMRKYPWDGAVKLRLEAQSRMQFRTCAAKVREESHCSLSSFSTAAKGTSHSATLDKNVVKIWENPSRRLSAVLPPLLSSEGTSRNISSLNVDWEKSVAYLGSSDGILTRWDLERASSQMTLSSLNVGHKLNSPTCTAHGSGVMFTAGRPSTGDSGGYRLCLWDPRSFAGSTAAGDSIIATKSSALRQLSISGLELVARTCCGLMSTHDIRMLRTSALSFSST